MSKSITFLFFGIFIIILGYLTFGTMNNGRINDRLEKIGLKKSYYAEGSFSYGWDYVPNYSGFMVYLLGGGVIAFGLNSYYSKLNSDSDIKQDISQMEINNNDINIVYKQIKKLKELYEDGILTDKEYEEKKQKLLNKI